MTGQPLLGRLWRWLLILCLGVGVAGGVWQATTASANETSPRAQMPHTARALSAQDKECLACHRIPTLRTTLPDGTQLSLTVDAAAYEASAHGQEDVHCTDCHTDIQKYPHPPVTAPTYRDWLVEINQTCADCHEDEAKQYAKGGHARALQEGNHDVALCSDCHGAHALQSLKDNRVAETKICARCHKEIYDTYKKSVHGAALMEENNPDVPTCVDCHKDHANAGPEYQSTFYLMSPQICAKCHADKKLMAKYGLSTYIWDTYVGDFHGTTVWVFEQLYPNQKVNTPVCVDCHGVHNILPPTDANSSVMQANLLNTCRRCHPNAKSLHFSKAWLGHYPPDWHRAPVATLVRWFYAIIIPLTIGGMAIFVVIDAYRQIRDRKGGRKS